MSDNLSNKDNKYFQQALSSMVTNMAYGDAIIHMYEQGLTVEEIHKNLDYPVTIETINSVIFEYEKKKESGQDEYEYVLKYDQFGRRSFIRVKKDGSSVSS